jgi:hypothetical protein
MRGIPMHTNEPKGERKAGAVGDRQPGPVSDGQLGSIAEQGFFLTPGSLAAARAACAELVFARAMIEAQTATIEALHARLALGFKTAA